MSTYSTTGRPPWSVTMWVDDNAIYVELPVKDSAPYITKYPLTEGGLQKALYIMHKAHRDNRPLGGSYQLPDQPIVRKAAKSQFTDDQRAKARATLKRLGKI